MPRARIIRTGVFAGLLGATLILGGAAYLTWTLVLKQTEQRLELLASLASSRADSTFAKATQALRSLHDSPLPRCSVDSIEQMRLVAIDTVAVKSVGYVEEEIFLCSSWGPIGKNVTPWAQDFQTQDGVGVSINVQPREVPAKPMLALQYAAFHLLIDPEHFLETSLEPGVSLALGTRDGRWLGEPAEGFARVLTRIHAAPASGLKDGYVYTRITRGNWQAVAAVSRKEMLSDLWQEQLLLLPLGLAMAGLWVWAVVRHTRKRLSPLADLMRAVAEGEFCAFYQPIIDLRDGRCVGAEALVRWLHEDGSVSMPDTFLPLAESSGLILPITEQVIAAACADLGSSLASGRLEHVSLNLSARDVATGHYQPYLAQAMRKAGIGAAAVWLEVTESCLINIEEARRTLAVSREAGHRVALDDFGTGYSSLQYLKRLPLDLLKIDRSFVQSLEQNAGCPVTDHTIALARHLQLELVAEGVETQEQLQYLRLRGVQYGQGWLFGKAMPLPAFLAFVAASQAPASSPGCEPLFTGQAACQPHR
ncbi:EAL domain-containing protein [Pseudomonas sp. CAN2814]|uniref:EAL domain-containing protein n=1 Tax=Pseudomonas sp. CAN1 TaxID=3046726 RepID=UPI0026495372|nr:EAL domain-containing protein [Pseudomonas sp. CAN1]MDN6859189.1 EAL domain-containing protein [Pseudomonas sp. CAN1]